MYSRFEGMPIAEQAQIILDEGVYVSKSKYRNLEISLYRVGEEFVEIWYIPLIDQIKKIEPVSGKLINPYLKHLAVAYKN